MPINPSNLQWCLKGPYKMGDGSLKFDLVVFESSPIQGGVAEIRATASVHVDGAMVCRGLAEALRQVADQLPPDLITALERN